MGRRQGGLLMQVGVNAGKSTPHTIAMAGVVLAWRARIAGHPCEAALESVLRDALASLLVSFDKALWDKVGVARRCHLLPYSCSRAACPMELYRCLFVIDSV